VKQYVAALDNLDTSYYTYSYYGVDGNGDRALEAVAIRRLNQDDPAVNAAVEHSDVLADGIYLTTENWAAYANAVGRAAIGSRSFTDANVKELIEDALAQTQRTDITAPLFDGLVVARNNVEHIIDIQTVQDDDGFVVPEEITVNKSTPAAVNVPAAYVSERITAENELQQVSLGAESRFKNPHAQSGPPGRRGNHLHRRTHPVGGLYANALRSGHGPLLLAEPTEARSPKRLRSATDRNRAADSRFVLKDGRLQNRHRRQMASRLRFRPKRGR
jgi:hypothetical protein